MTTEEKKYLNIYQRLLEVMKKVGYVQKDQKKVNGQYTYVKNDDVNEKLRQHIMDQEVIAIPTILESMQDGNRSVVKVSIAFVCADNPSDNVVVHFYGHGVDNQDKGVGKATTYAIKYALLKLFMLTTGDDADVEKHQIDYKPAEDLKKESDVEDKMEQLLENFKESEIELVTKYIQSLCKKVGKGKDYVVRNAVKRIEDFKSGFENWKTVPV